MMHDLQNALTQLRKTKPLILCLTNLVTMDFMANGLLSLGAAPIMSQDERELEALVRMSHAVYLNIGTLDADFIKRANLAVELATSHHKPIILDPVGAGATPIRTTSARSLMMSADIIRGNASEIMALLDDNNQTLGVESSHPVSDAKHHAILLARRHDCTLVISGAIDFITNGSQETQLGFGSALMPFVTGMGCTLTAVMAAFRAILPNAYEAAHLATAYYGLCGHLAAQKTNQPGSFRTFFIDELYKADFDSMRSIPHAI